MGNYFDGVTDHDGAVATDRLLRKSRLLSYAGWGHTAYGRSECVTDYIDDYLVTGSLPPHWRGMPGQPEPVPAAGGAYGAADAHVGLRMPWLLHTELPAGSS